MNNFLTKKDLSLLAEHIKLWSSELGFSSIGITDIDLSQDQRYLEKWIEKDYHGEMKYMEKHGKEPVPPPPECCDLYPIIKKTRSY